ncbi:MAG: anthranilate phosphoribosyltransferase [Myxococcales bacterium]|nr:anthranilate phosphoribosyltransferase [Myxococcales bacterium]
MIQDVLRTLIEGRDLEEAEATRAVEWVLSGEASPAQIAAFATAMRMKGETVTEIAAAARCLRRRCDPVDGLPGVLLDTCGTGGGASKTFNVSTVAAVVVAACGVPVAKHGLRAVTSRTGSADLVEALGVRIDASRATVSRCLREVGIAFLYAPAFHVALLNAGVVRQELGIRTMFDLLAPLANPAGATHQLLGVHSPRYLRTLAEVLSRLGARRAWVLHGAGGMDEVSPLGPTQVVSVRQGVLIESTVVPSDFGVEPTTAEALVGGDPATNAEITRSVLAGEPSGRRTAVVLNAAAALVVAEVTTDLREAAEMAQRAIDSGAARRTLARWVDVSNENTDAAAPRGPGGESA